MRSNVSSSTKITGAPSSSSLDWAFLSQAEDVEREVWWIVTDRRLEASTSPFRILRAAAVQTLKKDKSQNLGSQNRLTGIPFKFCKSLQVVLEDSQSWRVVSLCQKPAREIGRMRLLQTSPIRWEVTIKPAAFEEHFGLSTGILFRQFLCLLDLDQKGKLIKMSCPSYVRDRRLGEIVQFKTLEYESQGSPLLKIEGDVKKDLQVIATFKSDVPLTGDIALKVKKIPFQKSVEEKTEFSNSQGPTRGGSNGEKEVEEKSENDSQKGKEASEEGGSSQNQEEKGRQSNEPENLSRDKGQESSSPEGQNPVPPIEEPPVAPSR